MSSRAKAILEMALKKDFLFEAPPVPNLNIRSVICNDEVINDHQSNEVVLQDLTNIQTDDDDNLEFTVASMTVRNYELVEDRQSTEVVIQELTNVRTDKKIRNSENEDESDRTDPDYRPIAIEQQENKQEEEKFIAGSRRRQKRRHVDESKWKVNTNKRKREEGKQYRGRKLIDDRWAYNISKNERRMQERCKCKQTENKNTRVNCGMLSEEDRKTLFGDFWKMDKKEKKMYVKMLVTKEEIKRPRDRTEEDNSRRKYSYYYHLMKGEEKIRVCKKMFLSTLCIGEWSVLAWKNEENHNKGQIHQTAEINKDLLKPEEPKTEVTRRSIFQYRKQNVSLFFDSMPKMESHYCRARSTKKYLEPVWTSKSELYKFYVNNWCKEKMIEPVCLSLFMNEFDDKNLGIFCPKKDECSVCVARKTDNLDEIKYQLHQAKKIEAREEKDNDKKSDKNKVYTMDLQSVLLAPKSTVSLLYYKQKLVVHNFTIFNIKSREGYCFIWNETEGGLSSNEFSSILSHFITQEITEIDKDEQLIFYSDGCCGQNRNVTLSNALLHLSKEKNIIICQKYLEKGHTQMEADAMHATIERKLKNSKINVPADYVGVCLRARQNPKPYSVKYLTHDFFNNYSNLRYVNSIRPGKKVGDPTVQDIRALRYNPSGTIDYKLRHSEDWKDLPARMNQKLDTNIPKLYKEKLKISLEKYNQLQEIKVSLERDYHGFYEALPHE